MSNIKSKRRFSAIQQNATSVMSVAMVLFLLGLVAFLGVFSHRLTSDLKENIGFDVVVSQQASEGEVNSLKQLFTTAPFVRSVRFVSRDEALKEWERETGEDLMEVVGVNPLSAEFEVRVKAQYVCADSLNKIEYKLKQMPGVEHIDMHKDVVDKINTNLSRLAMVVLVVAGLLLLISVALINNTVRLTVYSRRFLIHTMKLVGAKPSFIRRPIVLSNMVCGIVAAFIASALLAAALYYLVEFESGWSELVCMFDVAVVLCSLFIAGALLCSIAAAFAANRFIGLDYDDLFTK
ncbi:MAG: cell division protein FtsX [Muribaculaceae bacterium]